MTKCQNRQCDDRHYCEVTYIDTLSTTFLISSVLFHLDEVAQTIFSPILRKEINASSTLTKTFATFLLTIKCFINI